MKEDLPPTGVPRMTSNNVHFCRSKTEVPLLSNKGNTPQNLLSSFTSNAKLHQDLAGIWPSNVFTFTLDFVFFGGRHASFTPLSQYSGSIAEWKQLALVHWNNSGSFRHQIPSTLVHFLAAVAAAGSLGNCLNCLILLEAVSSPSCPWEQLMVSLQTGFSTSRPFFSI